MIEYNNITAYEYFNNIFSVYYSNPALNLPLVTIDESPRPKKRYCYTSDTLLDSIYVASGNSVRMFTTPSYPPQLLEANSNDPGARLQVEVDENTSPELSDEWLTSTGTDTRSYSKRQWDEKSIPDPQIYH